MVMRIAVCVCVCARVSVDREACAGNAALARAKVGTTRTRVYRLFHSILNKNQNVVIQFC